MVAAGQRAEYDAGADEGAGWFGAADGGWRESFWGRMQVELLNRKTWKTRIELATAIHDYIELWHNTRRRHSALKMLTPHRIRDPSHHQPSRLTPEPRLHEHGGRSHLLPNPARLRKSQEALGFASGIHRNYVGALERGEVNPTFRTLLALATGLELPLSDIVALYEARQAEHRESRL